MSLNLDVVGTTGGPVELSWTSTDALLYALGVGAGMPDPGRELAFTTENSHGVDQRVLPTFGLVLGAESPVPLTALGTFDDVMVVHAEQRIEILEPLGPAGRLLLTGGPVEMTDKRSGALVVSESTATDPDSGAILFRTRTGVFIRGEGGFGGHRAAAGAPAQETAPASAGPSVVAPPVAAPSAAKPPARPPDHSVTYQTLPQQALLYRLSGDRNPLHSDPAFAASGGFERPILHGLCTYGFAGRALLHTLCGSDPGRFRSMSGRFGKPVLPGQALTTDIWADPDGTGASFRTTADGVTVLGRGRCAFTPAVTEA